jgi:hypothetical protein
MSLRANSSGEAYSRVDFNNGRRRVGGPKIGVKVLGKPTPAELAPRAAIHDIATAI